jgi:hypothetical protein
MSTPRIEWRPVIRHRAGRCIRHHHAGYRHIDGCRFNVNMRCVELCVRQSEEHDNREQRSRLLLARDVGQEPRQKRLEFMLRHASILLYGSADASLRTSLRTLR